jgi:hypothetical protein
MPKAPSAKKSSARSGPTPAQENAALRRALAKLEREKAELAAKAARPVDPATIPSAPASSFASIPPPPTDPLAVQEWIGLTIAAALNDTIREPKMSPERRRKEIRTLAAAYAKTVPDMRRWQAEQAAKEHRKPIEQRASTKGAPELKPIS